MRAHKISDRRAFTQKLRAGDHREIDRFGLGGLHDIGDPIPGPDRNRGFVDDDQGCCHCLGNGFRGGFDILQIGISIHPRGGSYSNKGKLRPIEGFFIRICKCQSPALDVAADEFFEARLINRHNPLSEILDAFLIHIQRTDIVPQIGKTGCGY